MHQVFRALTHVDALLAPSVFPERCFKRSGFLFVDYFAERFLRWILPLKLRRTTVDETAARPIVPQKALPSFMTKEVWGLGWRGMSSCTSPRTERALTSAEVLSGTIASISPL